MLPATPSPISKQSASGLESKRYSLASGSRGTFAGRIAPAPRGANGFGYDPIFEPVSEPPGGATVGEWPPERKQAVSHRARAARRMAPILERLGF